MSSVVLSDAEFFERLKPLLLDVLKQQCQSCSLSESVTTPEDRLLTEVEVSKMLRCSVRCLQTWRQKHGQGPAWKKLNGRLVRYPYSDVIKFLDESGPGFSSHPSHN